LRTKCGQTLCSQIAILHEIPLSLEDRLEEQLASLELYPEFLLQTEDGVLKVNRLRAEVSL
jgi:hypothetical protein